MRTKLKQSSYNLVPQNLRVLIIGNTTYDWYAPAWKRALETLEVDTHLLDCTQLLSKNRFTRYMEQRFLVGPAMRLLNQRVLQLTQELAPHVVLLYANNFIYPSTVKKLTKHAWVTTFQNDNPFGLLKDRAYFRHFKKGLRFADSHHVFREKNIEDYKVIGIERVRTLYGYYVPWLDYPPVFTQEEYNQYHHKIVFIGHGEKDQRIAYVQALIDSKLPFELYGPRKRWKQNLPNVYYKELKPVYPIHGIGYRKTLAASQISLAFFSRANEDQYTTRAFEIPAVGGFLLCERTSVMESLYKEDREAVFFSSVEELIDKCRFYLSHEEQRLEIARAGHKRCVSSGYDVISRMSQWLADILFWMKS